MEAKKNTNSNPWVVWKWPCNPMVVFMVLVTAFIVMSTARTSWRESRAAQYKDFGSCNPFSGKWVYDNSTHPLYSGLRCAYMNDEIACDKFGRNDTRYQGWRWQPHGCNLPKFDAREFLERLRGKRMVFVGDSLGRNQWMSMICLLDSSIASDHRSFVMNGSLMSFRAEEFNASVDFYWSPVLLESNCDDPVNHRISDRILRAGEIGKHARHWTDADILVFDSYLWWKKPRIKAKFMYGPIDDKNSTYQEMELIEGFELALKTWADWIELKVDTLRTKVFFATLSPTHVWGEEWGSASNQNCYSETEPITKEGYASRGSDYRFTRILEDVISGLKKRGVSVQMLNITQLSEYRKDGHPSIYRKQWDNLTEEQLANPSSYADCNHWCLPGVPDTWNEILYAYIVSQ